MDAETPARSSIPGIPRCCCGKDDCAFLRYNGTLLEGLERDVQTAAQLGQALLIRHEAYMADAEQERLQMAASIERLEQEKRELEEQNAQTILENRDLLDQLETLNNAVSESDSQVQNLTATLKATNEELLRLTALVARTESLERQLAQLEREQAQLQDTLATTAEDERTAVQRWKNAERIISDLQHQIDRIESEAKEERERHVEVVTRMERRKAVEVELESAAGRLKGAAAAKTVGRNRSSNVVSHFVKDILQDNANLQMGIVELREMLLNSNEEVERLREQLLLHQPLDQSSDGSRTPTLRKELGLETPHKELHVHHHYHPPAKADEPPKKTPLQRRVKKKRHVISPGHFTPPPGYHTPRSSLSRVSPGMSSPTYVPSPSSTAAILSQTSVTVPQTPHRWSVQSNQTGVSIAGSSVPNSPYSASHRTSSIFDRVFSDAGYESSRPTSPESADPGSPRCVPMKGLQTQGHLFGGNLPNRSSRPILHDGGMRSVSTPIALPTKSTISPAATVVPSDEAKGPEAFPLPPVDSGHETEDFILSPSGQPTIPEESEDSSGEASNPLTPTPDTEIDITTEDIYNSVRPGLRRHASHESLISVSGMDIHTLSSRPSQLLMRGGLFAAPALSPPSVSSLSTQPVLSAMTATATRASPFEGVFDSSSFNRSLLFGMAADQRRAASGKSSKETLGRRVGGWVFGKWGSTPTPTSPLAASPAPPASMERSSSSVPIISGSAASRLAATDAGNTTMESQAVLAEGNDIATGSKDAATGSKDPARDDAQSIFSTASSDSTGAKRRLQQFKLRTPGVNQDGPILGFFTPETKAPYKVVVTNVDTEALREVLEE